MSGVIGVLFGLSLGMISGFIFGYSLRDEHK